MNFATNNVDWLVSDISADLDRHWGGKRRRIENVSYQEVKKLGRVLKLGKVLLDEIMEEIENGNIAPSVQLSRQNVRSLIDSVFTELNEREKKIMLDGVVRMVIERTIAADAQTFTAKLGNVSESGFFRFLQAMGLRSAK